MSVMPYLSARDLCRASRCSASSGVGRFQKRDTFRASFPRGPKDLDAGFLLNDLGSAEGDVAKRSRIIRELVNYFLSFGHHVTSSSL